MLAGAGGRWSLGRSVRSDMRRLRGADDAERRRRGFFDHRADVLSGERARELTALQAVDDLHAAHVTRVLPRAEELTIEDQIFGHVLQELVERGPTNEL